MQAWGQYFSRNPESGVKRPSAQVYLDNPDQKLPWLALQRSAPEVAARIEAEADRSERTLGQAVQTHFRLEQGQLQLGDFQPLDCSPAAALKIRIQLVNEGLLRPDQAVIQTDPEVLHRMLQAQLKPGPAPLGVGSGNGWGACSGQVAFDYAECLRLHSQGAPVVLVTQQLSYAHRDCLDLVSGAVIFQGSSLALEQFQKPCVRIEPRPFRSGQWLSLDSQSGQVYDQALKLQPGRLSSDARTLLEWADSHRPLEIRANPSTLEDLGQALDWGASGVGLFRMDTLLLKPAQLELFQTCLRQICVEGKSESTEMSLLVEQLSRECAALFECAGAVPFNLRMLDAPVSLMLRYWQESGRLAADFWQEPLQSWLHELNPTQGLRCGRLGLLYPPLMEIQMRACLQARRQHRVQLQLMLPGVCAAAELAQARRLCAEICQQEQVQMPLMGSMLEIPRACLTADRLAEQADFLSFGTGDLSETTFGISRYDSALSFLPGYLDQAILGRDPFQSIDQAGVGALMAIAVEKLKPHRHRLELGTCGAQAADPSSLDYCQRLGLNYVSLAPRYIPAARLVLAQQALNAKKPRT